ncbi:hypothetical protein DIURU_003628 [Diutina rugosa]|uniref:Uncharacterized protein n=1 Tax=Diutina rugosa TaxID=5481 RepID=A0A642ULN3_DIURU|nr:uncharacterized protein DIURU_003628 [Diutina rugosa]KAA8901258.1 hypothetical protein DIURU_003628 [Diutina rugosa]
MCLPVVRPDLASSSDDDSEDEAHCYQAEQIRAKRRASSRVSFVIDRDLSRACAQYSDEDEEDTLQFIQKHGMGSPFGQTLPSSNPPDLDLSCGRRNSSFLQISDAPHPVGMPSPVQSPMESSQEDRAARTRCFDYLVGAIDEAWARYCDAATYVEDEVYGYNTPQSVVTDDEEDYCDNTTDITDYEDDDEEAVKPSQYSAPVRPQFKPRMSMSGPPTPAGSAASASGAPHLQHLKDRLTKAKYYLQDLVDSDDGYNVSCFWKRWDMIKYATIELVEDDDDDEVVEATIEELEAGRMA